MLTVISPAKRLNEVAAPLDMGQTLPIFQAQANQLAKTARQLSAQDLSRLMDISPALGALNHARFQRFGKDAARYPAAFMFDGDTYTGLDAASLSPDALRWADGHLRILSGLYGLLAPRDGIEPYRLEMGTRLENPKGADLYTFWADQIARALNGLAQEQNATVLVNCASIEYFSAVDLKALRLAVITPVFLEIDGGRARTISFWAKQARGAMARFIADGHITNPDDLRGFGIGGYQYQPDLSGSGKFVFARPYQPAASTRAA